MWIPNILQRCRSLWAKLKLKQRIFIKFKLGKIVQTSVLWVLCFLEQKSLGTRNTFTLPLLFPLWKGNIHTRKQKCRCNRKKHREAKTLPKHLFWNTLQFRLFHLNLRSYSSRNKINKNKLTLAKDRHRSGCFTKRVSPKYEINLWLVS